METSFTEKIALLFQESSSVTANVWLPQFYLHSDDKYKNKLVFFSDNT